MANLKKNDELFFLIPPGSRILVPCQQDDHSLFLLDILNRYKTYFAKKDFELMPVSFSFFSSDEGVKGLPLLKHLEVEQEMEARKRANEKYASYCNKLKRVAMGKEAEALGCSLIALPTCFEEAYSLFEKSMLEDGELKTFAFASPVPSSKARFIRPFLSLEEESIIKGEEELGLQSQRLFNPLSFSSKQKDAIKKAFLYNDKVNFPCLHLTPTLPLLSDCRFVSINGQIKAIKGEETIASFKVEWLDAHRLRIFDFSSLEGLGKDVLDSYCLLTLEKKKPPLQIILSKPFIENLEGYEIHNELAYRKIWRKEDILHNK